MIGWFGEDVWEVVSDAGDVIVSVAGEIPIVPELAELAKDFATTPGGAVVFRALATSLTGGLAPILGPQLATTAFAVPGLVRGEDFWRAWFDEFRWRAEKTSDVLAPGMLPVGAKEAIDKLRAMVPEDAWDMALPELAAALGVDEWSASMALAYLWPDAFPIPDRGNFDPLTGRLYGALERAGVFDFNRRRLREAYALPTAVSAFGAGYQGAKSGVAWTTGGRVLSSSPPPPVPAPGPVAFGGGAPRSPAKAAGDVVLALVVTAAAGALVWFYVGERR